MDESGPRFRERKKQRKDLITSKNSVEFARNYLNSESISDLGKCLLNKMLLTGMIDDFTSPSAVQLIADHCDELLRASRRTRDGNGFELIKGCIDPFKYKHVLELFNANYSSLLGADQKCTFWTICTAFLIIDYEVNTDLIFDMPLAHDEQDFEIFLRNYPEFLIRTWDSSSLLQFQLCMKRAVRCFGKRNNMGCLVELVTRITKGRNVALVCNTSGGGLKSYGHQTEVSTEKCRILIFQRESGVQPRTRKNTRPQPGLPQTILSPSAIPSVPGINAPRETAQILGPIGCLSQDQYLTTGRQVAEMYLGQRDTDTYFHKGMPQVSSNLPFQHRREETFPPYQAMVAPGLEGIPGGCPLHFQGSFHGSRLAVTPQMYRYTMHGPMFQFSMHTSPTMNMHSGVGTSTGTIVVNNNGVNAYSGWGSQEPFPLPAVNHFAHHHQQCSGQNSAGAGAWATQQQYYYHK